MTGLLLTLDLEISLYIEEIDLVEHRSLGHWIMWSLILILSQKTRGIYSLMIRCHWRIWSRLIWTDCQQGTFLRHLHRGRCHICRFTIGLSGCLGDVGGSFVLILWSLTLTKIMTYAVATIVSAVTFIFVWLIFGFAAVVLAVGQVVV